MSDEEVAASGRTGALVAALGWLNRGLKLLLFTITLAGLGLLAVAPLREAAGSRLAEIGSQGIGPYGVALVAPAPAAAAPATNIHLTPPEELLGVNCDRCHALPRTVASSSDVLPTTRNVCLECHPSQKQQLEAPSTHPPFKGGECTSCHRAHPASDEGPPRPALLTQPAKDLCLTCHADKREQQSFPFAHPPFATGQCLSCHDPHASQTQPTLKAPGEQLCFSCHQNVAKALSEPVQHPPFTAGNCAACHSPHASKQAGQLRAPLQEVCFTCHAGPMARMPGWHKPVQEGWCADCHQPHGGKYEYLTRLSPGVLCLTCHRK